MADDRDHAAARQSILDYMAARSDWERAAIRQIRLRRTGTAEAESEAQIQAGYEALIARYCAPRVSALKLRYHFGDPPTVDPAWTTILSVQGVRGAIRVGTEERRPDGLGPATYEYELVDVDGTLRISGRRLVAGPGMSIRDVF